MTALLALLAAGLLAVTLVPGPGAAVATCVPRVIDDQQLACAGFEADPGRRACVKESLNPPAPGTWQDSTTCVPVPCPPQVCAFVVHPPWGLLA